MQAAGFLTAGQTRENPKYLLNMFILVCFFLFYFFPVIAMSQITEDNV